jgi:hypothetical protein
MTDLRSVFSTAAKTYHRLRISTEPPTTKVVGFHLELCVSPDRPGGFLVEQYVEES